MSRLGHINDILPGELLCRIFRLSLDLRHLKRDRCRLSLVCRLWCRWVQESASLWTDIIASEGLGYLRKSFERSKDAPIELSYPGHTLAVCTMRVDKFLQEASPHVARWRSLSIVPSYPVNWDETLAPLEANRVPNLEALNIEGRTPSLPTPTGSTTITIGDPDGVFPKLRNISLCGVPVTIRVTGLTALRSFVLIWIPEMSLRPVVGVLENSPHLEQLEVENCKGLKIAEKNWSVGPIKFERLVDVGLKGLDAAVTNFILSIVHAPNCEKLIITCNITDPPPRSVLFNASISHLLLPFSEDGLQRPLLNVFVDEDGDHCIYIQVGYIGIKVRVSADHGVSHLNNVLCWIGDNSGSEASYPVHLAFSLDFPYTGYVEAFGPQFSVEHLDVFEDSEDVLLEYLSHRGRQNSSGWPIPRLEDLDCHLNLFEKADTPLLDMLKARYGRAGTEQSVEAETSTPLRSIKLYSKTRPDELIRRIQEILRNVEISWACVSN